MDADLALALRLLADHRTRIAAAAHRLACRLEPQFAWIPEPTAVGSIANTLRVVETFLRTNDPTPVLENVRATVRLRRLGGFSVGALAVMSHAYLPAVRRSFLRHAADVEAALRAFDRVESALLPLAAVLLRELHAASPGDEADASPFSAVARTEETPERPAFELLSVDE